MQRLCALATVPLVALAVACSSCKGPTGPVQESARAALPAVQSPAPTVSPGAESTATESGATESAAALGGKVIVEMYYPGSEEHAPIRALVGKIEARYGGKVQAEFVNFMAPEGRQRMEAKGLTCGTILIDGKAEWEVHGPDGKARSVTFERGMGATWHEEDLYRVLDELTGAQTHG